VRFALGSVVFVDDRIGSSLPLVRELRKMPAVVETSMRAFIRLIAVTTALAAVLPATAQDVAPAQQGDSRASAPAWEGLPFTSLADFESKVPIGMSRRDLTRTLGRPEMTMPGQGDDQVYHYGYHLTDGRDLRAVVVLRDGDVFIRRLYISSVDGETRRAN
jgi:hypothetical protein